MLSAIGHRLKKIRVRTIFFCILGILIFLLPTALALRTVYLENAANSEITFFVTAWNADHEQLASEEISDDPDRGSSFADIMYRIIVNATESTKPPFEPEDGIPIYVRAVHNGTTAEYTCYFSFMTDESFYTNASGQVFRIRKGDCFDFLSSPYAQTLYDTSKPPVLYTNIDEPITPSSISWFYRLQNDAFEQSTRETPTSEILLYNLAGAMDIHFSEEPDSCIVRATDPTSGRKIYEGPYRELSQITVEPETVLRIHVEAVWNEHRDALSHGTLTYDFDVMVHDRSSFTLNTQQLAPGDFLIVTCQNVRDLSKLTLQLNDTLQTYFYQTEDTVYCVVPYPTRFSKEHIEMTFTYGASTETFSVALQANSGKQSVILPDSSDSVRRALSIEAQLRAKELFASSFSPLSNHVYFQGNILLPTDYGYTVGYSYGNSLLLPDSSASSVSYGVEYRSAQSGASVLAMMSGEVLSVGTCDALGRYVVVNHGLGIYTWYCHLSDFDVRVGDIVLAGEIIGKSGKGGVATGDGTLIVCTVNGHLCDPTLLANKKLP